MKFENYLRLKYSDTKSSLEELLKTDMPFLMCHALDKLAEMVLMQKYDEAQTKELVGERVERLKNDESKNN